RGARGVQYIFGDVDHRLGAADIHPRQVEHATLAGEGVLHVNDQDSSPRQVNLYRLGTRCKRKHGCSQTRPLEPTQVQVLGRYKTSLPMNPRLKTHSGNDPSWKRHTAVLLSYAFRTNCAFIS